MIGFSGLISQIHFWHDRLQRLSKQVTSDQSDEFNVELQKFISNLKDKYLLIASKGSNSAEEHYNELISYYCFTVSIETEVQDGNFFEFFSIWAKFTQTIASIVSKHEHGQVEIEAQNIEKLKEELEKAKIRLAGAQKYEAAMKEQLVKAEKILQATKENKEIDVDDQ